MSEFIFMEVGEGDLLLVAVMGMDSGSGGENWGARDVLVVVVWYSFYLYLVNILICSL